MINQTPSVEEFGGWYNIQGDYGDGHPVLRSQEPMPEFEHVEFFDLYMSEHEWFEQLVPARSDAPFDPLAEPPFFVRSDADDRTLGVDADFQCLTVPLLRRIQKEFLGRHPLWRVILIAEEPSLSIVIYPTVIRFGNRPVDTDPEEALREIVPRELALRTELERPRREHVALMQQWLRDAVPRMGDRPFLVVGVLDNYEGDYERLTICLLIPGTDQNALQLEGPAGSDNHFLAQSSAFGVDASGNMLSYVGVPDTAAFCCVPRLPPADYRGPLTLVEQATGKRHVFELKSEGIIRTKSAHSS